MINEFGVNEKYLDIRSKHGHSLSLEITKDEAHELIKKLEKQFGRPQEVTREEILAPEKISFLEESDGGSKGNK